MDRLIDVLNISIAGNSVQHYLTGLGFAVIMFAIFKFVIDRIIKKLTALAKKTENDIDDLVINIVHQAKWPIFAFIILFGAIAFFNFSEMYKQYLHYLLIILIVFQMMRLANNVIDYIALKAAKKNHDGANSYYITTVGKIVKFILWVMAIILILSNLGYNVSSLIAGFGIGGVAIALAVQNILGDLFSSLSIYFDKPFKIGDYIQVDTLTGNVKKIGLKTTRVTSLQGEEIIIPNNKLTNTNIQNFGKMKERRILFQIGVTYDTPTTKLKIIPKMLKDIIDSVKNIRLDRVHFKTFGESSLDFEIVYYVDSREYSDYMDEQQKINFKIKTAFDKAKIEMAFPTRTVHVVK
ncbi:mechanosensitive ion channel family protein [Patescibacteria group bacterium]|nr:mechanosensitive ion channel family protein [Patescibacteria group bacterium]